MKKDETFIEKIEDFSNFEFPSEDISYEEKEAIKKNIISVLSRLKNNNNLEYNINVTEKEAINIRENLGAKASETIMGVKDSMLMKSIIRKSIEDELKNETVIKFIEYQLPSFIYWGLSAVFNFAYITDKEFIWYGFDINYKLVTKGREKLEDIKTVGRVRDNEDDKHGVEFYIKGENSYFILMIHGEKKVSEMDEFIEYIHQNYKAKLFDKKKFAKKERNYYIVIAMLAIFGILMVLFQMKDINF
ncbi:MAG: hypothetical protein ACRC57_02015 [Sarcina sp.]